jgi:hypothetical protein
MFDLALDEDFSVYLNDRNEVASVTGRAEFEQSVRVMITEFMHNAVLGESNADIIKNKIRLQVARVAQEHDMVDGITNLDISTSPNSPNTYRVVINYESEEATSFEVTE